VDPLSWRRWLSCYMRMLVRTEEESEITEQLRGLMRSSSMLQLFLEGSTSLRRMDWTGGFCDSSVGRLESDCCFLFRMFSTVSLEFEGSSWDYSGFDVIMSWYCILSNESIYWDFGLISIDLSLLLYLFTWFVKDNLEETFVMPSSYFNSCFISFDLLIFNS